MAIIKGDYQSVMAAGWWINEAAEGSEPSEPTLSVTNDGDGDAVTCVVTGDDTATHTIYYRKTNAAAWTEGSSDTGDATIAQAGLDNATFYWFICVASDAGANSIPSEPVLIYVTDGTVTHTYEILAVLDTQQRGAEMVLLCTEAVTT